MVPVPDDPQEPRINPSATKEPAQTKRLLKIITDLLTDGELVKFRERLRKAKGCRCALKRGSRTTARVRY
jgi:hypothetical protein